MGRSFFMAQHAAQHTDETLTEATWPVAARRAYRATNPTNFAATSGDEPLDFPIRDEGDVRSCATLYGHSSDPEQCKRNIIAIAARLNLSHALPAAWASTSTRETTEAFVSDPETPFRPKPRIAQLKVCFIEDNAVSLNGRQYPADSVNALIASGQSALAQPDGPVITAYTSHNEANQDNPLALSGKATRIWREGTRGFALFDIPDTHAGRDMASLTAGGYLKTMSLRATGAVQRIERGKSIPQVGGKLQLQGIDFTSTPGHEVARIAGVMLESATGEPQAIIDHFDILEASILPDAEEETPQEEQHRMTTKNKAQPTAESGTLTEVAATPTPGAIQEGPQNDILAPLTSGDSQSVDGTPQSAYAAQVFPKVDAQIPADDYFHAAKSALAESRATHDHAAAALGMSCAPATLAKESIANRRVTKAMESHLVAIHDLHAGKCALPCEGSYQQMAALKAKPSPDDDADDAMEQHRVPAPVQPVAHPVTPVKESTPAMTEEEALALLRAQGYQIPEKKTDTQLLEEKLQTEFTAKLDAQRKAFEESQAKLLESFGKAQPAAQRTTLVESGVHTAGGAVRDPLPDSPRARRNRIQENLMKASWEDLADPSMPLPEGVTPEEVIKHFGRIMVLDYQEKYGTATIKARNS
jgi:hypothetical protein